MANAFTIRLGLQIEGQFFITDELLPSNSIFVCLPGVLLYFLMFISYQRLNDISRRQDCLHDLMWYATTESPKFSLIHHFSSIVYLRRAFRIVSDTDAADNSDIMIRTLLKSTDFKKYGISELESIL